MKIQFDQKKAKTAHGLMTTATVNIMNVFNLYDNKCSLALLLR